MEPHLPRATATLAQLASPLPWADLLGPFGAKPKLDLLDDDEIFVIPVCYNLPIA